MNPFTLSLHTLLVTFVVLWPVPRKTLVVTAIKWAVGITYFVWVSLLIASADPEPFIRAILEGMDAVVHYAMAGMVMSRKVYQAPTMWPDVVGALLLIWAITMESRWGFWDEGTRAAKVGVFFGRVCLAAASLIVGYSIAS